ncbi:MAG: NADP-dependent oxidoreductase [Desulfuromonadales bacterium]|nr:NADP-dependent oxidoreductase [Desulfuromonadales bacterium]
MSQNRQIILKQRPQGAIREADFAVREAAVPLLEPGQFLVQNSHFSLDAGFRKWMNEGADDNYLTAMPLDAPVQSIVLGRVVESHHSSYPADTLVLGRSAWESYSVFSDADFVQKLAVDSSFPLHEYLATLGPTGLTAYFGLLDIGRPKAGETVLVSAAGGAVGSVVGQIAKILGCRTVGIASSAEKCLWLKEQLGYDATINHQAPEGLEPQLRRELPEGFDIYFDNVGGRMLDLALLHMKERARVVLCGAISEYDKTGEHTGIHHLWEFITKRAMAAGFMFSDYVEEYPAAIQQMAAWIGQGKLKSVVEIYQGIEATPRAFCDMMEGRNRGKCIVRL